LRITKRYATPLPTSNEFALTKPLLALNIEKRHVIGYNLGIADERYVERTQAQQPGETVRLIGDDIGRFADICLSVVPELENGLLPGAQVTRGVAAR